MADDICHNGVIIMMITYSNLQNGMIIMMIMIYNTDNILTILSWIDHVEE